MKVNFENERGYVEDEKERCDILWIAKDTLKSHRIKATSFRAGGFALLPSDIKYLEDMEFWLIAPSSPTPITRCLWTGTGRRTSPTTLPRTT